MTSPLKWKHAKREKETSVTETTILAEQVEEHLSLFQSKLTNGSTNKEIWNEVKSAAVNAAGFESDGKSRSPEKVEVSPFGSEEGIFRISKRVGKDWKWCKAEVSFVRQKPFDCTSPKSVANSEFSLSAQSSIIKFSIAVETVRLWPLALRSPLFCLTFALFNLRLAI